MVFTFPGNHETAPITVTRLGYRRDDVPNPLGGVGN